MLKSISWQEFLTVMSVLSLIYFSILGIIYYREEIKNVFSGKARSSPKPQQGRKKNNSLIGQIKEEEGIDDEQEQQTLSSEQIDPIHNSQDALLGSVADFLKDLKDVIESIATDKLEKSESITLIKAVFSRYEQLKGTSYQQSVELFLYENAIDQFAFELSLEEIKHIWSR